MSTVRKWIWVVILCGMVSHSLVYSVEKSKKKSRKIIWVLPGNWGNPFDEKCYASMKMAGYDLKPMLAFHEKALEAGYDVVVADPWGIGLVPFPNSGRKNISTAPDDIKMIMIFDLFTNQYAYLVNYPKKKLVLFLWEPPSVMPQSFDRKNHSIFGKVFTWDDSFVDGKKYFKFFYPVLHPMVQEEPIPFSERKLCCLVATNRLSEHPNELYIERKKIIFFFFREHPEDLDLYGRGWDGLKIYKGQVEDKIQVLREHKFNICYENIKDVPGYITEKIFDCFQAGCVPVYWGASNVTQYIPEDCFIARQDFGSHEDLYLFLKNMPEEQYLAYIENIKRYLASREAQRFSLNNFVNITSKLLK